ncbi:MAG: SDR family NAD(P)-dependent oxidoreductase [Planctomycetaceae bacterium]|nr:SDR family NAD(P)-dependent oxidoreductase [Planctomycetaceae bacterium]MBV8316535.1 SDR family NAD(P)-dependent oxidoreductase [Planctomycetaceae bacterium]MBV8558988.1 SDR family NAD(P)-dependent oxidoreductase [Planctomycetaceae bacterium]MBV8610778.1 SDR family NAD(P)-dependent oxidoreductase [Singulisphaera sp.]
MENREKMLLGALVGAGVFWGIRAWLRSRRRIELAGRVVIVTGASSGHGFMVAQEAAVRGAHLVLVARDLEQLRGAEQELRRLGAASVMAVPADVADQAQVAAMVERVIAAHGRVDVLINNAGTIRVGPVEAMTLDDFRAVMATNFWGPLYTTLAVLPQMRAQRFGRIGNVVSLGGKGVMPHLLPYTASKFALTGLTEGLRAELARDNILVTGIYPSTMRSGGHRHAWFKGQQEAEYTWFALSDALPLVSTSARHVARRLWRAVCDGDAEVVVGWPAHLAIVLQNLFPNTTAEIQALVDQLVLPPSTNLDAPAVQGQDLQATIPNLLNRAFPASAQPGRA